jgi:hypothetical protein
MVEIWMNTPFEGGRHERRIAKIGKIEQNERSAQHELDQTTGHSCDTGS